MTRRNYLLGLVAALMVGTSVLLAPATLTVSVARAQSEIRSLPAVRSRPEFDSLGVVYDPDTPYALPHVMFVIDRQNKNRIYYVNSKLYKFHKDFVNGTYLSLERGQVFFENNYIKPNRRFILGTVAYQTPVRKWTFEYWEGDLIPPEQIKLTSDVINRTFFTPVAYKPNSLRQEQARSEEHTSELQSQSNLVCRLLLEKKKTNTTTTLINK